MKRRLDFNYSFAKRACVRYENLHGGKNVDIRRFVNFLIERPRILVGGEATIQELEDEIKRVEDKIKKMHPDNLREHWLENNHPKQFKGSMTLMKSNLRTFLTLNKKYRQELKQMLKAKQQELELERERKEREQQEFELERERKEREHDAMAAEDTFGRDLNKDTMHQERERDAMTVEDENARKIRQHDKAMLRNKNIQQIEHLFNELESIIQNTYDMSALFVSYFMDLKSTMSNYEKFKNQTFLFRLPTVLRQKNTDKWNQCKQLRVDILKTLGECAEKRTRRITTTKQMLSIQEAEREFNTLVVEEFVQNNLFEDGLYWIQSQNLDPVTNEVKKIELIQIEGKRISVESPVMGTSYFGLQPEFVRDQNMTKLDCMIRVATLVENTFSQIRSALYDKKYISSRNITIRYDENNIDNILRTITDAYMTLLNQENAHILQEYEDNMTRMSREGGSLRTLFTQFSRSCAPNFNLKNPGEWVTKDTPKETIIQINDLVNMEVVFVAQKLQQILTIFTEVDTIFSTHIRQKSFLSEFLATLKRLLQGSSITRRLMDYTSLQKIL